MILDLWGGGNLIAPSPEVTSLPPPPQEVIDEFIAWARASLGGIPMPVQLELDIVNICEETRPSDEFPDVPIARSADSSAT